MSVGLNYNVYQPTFHRRREDVVAPQSLAMADLDRIPGVDTVNNTITDIANEGKVKSRKALNILMTVGLGVAAFFTGKRISKTVLDSLSHQTVYLNSLSRGVEVIYGASRNLVKNINVEKGNSFVRFMKEKLVALPENMKNYARRGLSKDIELEKFMKEFKLKDVSEMDNKLTDIFNVKYCNTIVKNGISKFVSSVLGVVTGVETFIEVGADKNKNGIPDLFEQKNGKKIIEVAQPRFDEKVIEQARKMNSEDDDETEELD